MNRVRYFAALAATATLSLAWPAAAQTKIEVLSSQPTMVTGGDALVRITGTDTAPVVKVDGRDVSKAFKRYPKGGWVGLVDGLASGNNELVAGTARLTLVNHPINGTLFAGPQQDPYVCENEAFGLAKAIDTSCAAPTQVAYFYRSRNDKKWRPYDAKAPKPDDLDYTTNSLGYKAPLIVRRELGVINRAAYVISILHDPVLPLPTPTSSRSEEHTSELQSH